MSRKKRRAKTTRRLKGQGLPPGQMKPIFSERMIDGEIWSLAEHVGTSRDKELAKFEYQCEGYYVRCERLPERKLYYIWCKEGRPTEAMPTLLPGEVVKRVKTIGSLPRSTMVVLEGGQSA